MKKALLNKGDGWVYPILGPEDFDGYARNRPNNKWELVVTPYEKMLWMGNGPDFVRVINYNFWRKAQRRLRIWGIRL